jgi:hypothetical protein
MVFEPRRRAAAGRAVISAPAARDNRSRAEKRWEILTAAAGNPGLRTITGFNHPPAFSRLLNAEMARYGIAG